MWEKLLDLLASAGTLATPIVIVHPWQGGVILRLGKYLKTIETGPHLKWPFLEDYVLTETCTTTIRLPPQSLTTKDGHAVVVGCIIKYHVNDVRELICNVWDAKDVLIDVTMGTIGRKIEMNTYDELRSGSPAREVLEAVRKEVNAFGFKVEAVTFTDFSKMRSIRLVQPRAKDLDN